MPFVDLAAGRLFDSRQERQTNTGWGLGVKLQMLQEIGFGTISLDEHLFGPNSLRRDALGIPRLMAAGASAFQVTACAKQGDSK